MADIAQGTLALGPEQQARIQQRIEDDCNRTLGEVALGLRQGGAFGLPMTPRLFRSLFQSVYAEASARALNQELGPVQPADIQ